MRNVRQSAGRKGGYVIPTPLSYHMKRQKNDIKFEGIVQYQ